MANLRSYTFCNHFMTLAVSLPCHLVHYRLLRHGHWLANILPIESTWPQIVFLAVQFELTGCELSPHTSQIELPCCQIRKRKGYVVFGYTGTWRFPQPWWHSELPQFIIILLAGVFQVGYLKGLIFFFVHFLFIFCRQI